MQTVTKANGYLFVLPGSHADPGKLLPHGYPDWKVRFSPTPCQAPAER